MSVGVSVVTQKEWQVADTLARACTQHTDKHNPQITARTQRVMRVLTQRHQCIQIDCTQASLVTVATFSHSGASLHKAALTFSRQWRLPYWTTIPHTAPTYNAPPYIKLLTIHHTSPTIRPNHTPHHTSCTIHHTPYASHHTPYIHHSRYLTHNMHTPDCRASSIGPHRSAM